MLGDLMGNMEEQQKAMRKKLAEITVEGESGNGAVKVAANANRKLTDLKIDREKLDWDDIEMVQDLILAAVNKALEEAAAKESEETQKMVKDMLPPGLGGLGNIFG